jgi:basic membrane protein A
MDLSNRGVGVALDENNESLVTYAMLSETYAAADKIIRGDIKVHDYMADESCPALDF